MTNITTGLCKYKDLFGRPNEGIHSYRVMGVAAADVIQTIIGALLFSWIFRTSVAWTLGGFFLVGILAHRLFCVRTQVDKWLFG